MIAYVRDTGKFTGANVDNASGSFAALPAIGSFVVVGSSVYAGSIDNNATTASDNQSHTYAKDVESLHAGASAGAAIHTTRVTASSGTFTVTIDTATNTGNYIVGVGAEFRGIKVTTPKDQSTSNSSTVTVTSGNTGTTGSIAQAYELVIAVTNVNANDVNLNITTPASSGYTSLAVQQDSQAIIGAEISYKIVAAVGTQTASWTFDTATYNAVICTYKADLGCSLASSGVGR